MHLHTIGCCCRFDPLVFIFPGASGWILIGALVGAYLTTILYFNDWIINGCKKLEDEEDEDADESGKFAFNLNGLFYALAFCVPVPSYYHPAILSSIRRHSHGSPNKRQLLTTFRPPTFSLVQFSLVHLGCIYLTRYAILVVVRYGAPGVFWLYFIGYYLLTQSSVHPSKFTLHPQTPVR